MMHLGDIVSGEIHGGGISHASVASNGAAATYGGAGTALKWRAPANCKIVGAAWTPDGADNATTITASYRLLTLVNGGQAAAGTTVLASMNLTASLASNASRNLTLASVATLSKGDIIYASQSKIGRAHV